MSQVNVNYPAGGAPDRGTGAGTILAVLLALAVVALLVWGLALGGFGGGAPATTGSAPGATSGQAPGGGATINVNPSVNVQPPASSGGTSGSGTSTGAGTTAGSTTGTTGSGTTGGSTTAPAKP